MTEYEYLLLESAKAEDEARKIITKSIELRQKAQNLTIKEAEAEHVQPC